MNTFPNSGDSGVGLDFNPEMHAVTASRRSLNIGDLHEASPLK
jgi:hypothetical protein